MNNVASILLLVFLLFCQSGYDKLFYWKTTTVDERSLCTNHVPLALAHVLDVKLISEFYALWVVSIISKR
jgi:hypothetical protein